MNAQVTGLKDTVSAIRSLGMLLVSDQVAKVSVPFPGELVPPASS